MKLKEVQANFDAEILRQFHTKIVQPVTLPPVIERILEEFTEIDIKAERIGAAVQRNQYYEHWLLQEVKALGLKDNVPSLNAAIVLLGMQNVREFCAGLYMIRGVLGRKPAAGKDGKLEPKPKDLVKFAVKTEEYAQSRRLQHVTNAFPAGLLFDIVATVAREHFKVSKTFEELLGETYKHSLRAAMIGLEIAKTFKSFSYMRYVFAACLTHDIGKLVMQMLFGEKYEKFRAELAKKPVNRVVRYYIEEKTFGVTHEYFSAELIWHYKLLRPAYRAVLFHHGAFLAPAQADLQSFAGLISLASQMSSYFRIPKDTGDAAYESWLTPELGRFSMDRKVLLNVMSKMGRESFG